MPGLTFCLPALPIHMRPLSLPCFPPLPSTQSKEQVKATERVNKSSLATITQLCDIFDLSKDGKKVCLYVWGGRERGG